MVTGGKEGCVPCDTSRGGDDDKEMADGGSGEAGVVAGDAEEGSGGRGGQAERESGMDDEDEDLLLQKAMEMSLQTEPGAGA